MEKEEQYMKLIELRRVATQAKTELKLMKTKVARLERQAKKKDDQVETTLGKAAAAITAALSRDQDKDGNNMHDPSFVDTSNAKMVARLQRQVYSLLENLRKKEREMKEIKREKRNIKLQETLVELEEYKYEVQRLKEILDYRVHSNLSTDNDSIENGSIMDSNVDFNEFKDTICVLKVQRNHLMEENQQTWRAKSVKWKK